MLRFLAYLLAFTLSASIAYLIYPMVPALIMDVAGTSFTKDMHQLLLDDVLVVSAAYVSLTLLIFSIFAYLLPAFIEAIYIGIALARLDKLPPSSSDHAKTSISEFLNVFTDLRFLHQEAQMYSGYLFQDNDQAKPAATAPDAEETPAKPTNILKRFQAKGINTAPVYASAPADIIFGQEQLVIGRLPWWLFANLSKFLIGFGTLVAIFSLAGETLSARANAASGAVYVLPPIEPALLVLSFCLSASIIIFLTCQLTTDFMKAHVQNLCIQINKLFLHYENDEHLRQIAKLAQGNQDGFQRAINEQTSSISAMLREERRQSLVQTNQSIEDFSVAVQKAIQPALDQLTKGSKALASSQHEHIKKALEAALIQFTQNMQDHYGNQLHEIGAMLSSSAELAGKMEKNFSQSSELLNGQITEHHKALQTQFEKTLKSLEVAQAEHQDATLKQLNKVIDELRAELASNSKLLDSSQKKLSTALEKGVSGLRSFSRISAHIKAISTGSREAVENMSELTTQLLQLEKNLPQKVNNTAAAKMNIAPEVISALDRLREENLRKTSDLPELTS